MYPVIALTIIGFGVGSNTGLMASDMARVQIFKDVELEDCLNVGWIMPSRDEVKRAISAYRQVGFTEEAKEIEHSGSSD
jgi:hypothetical protein